MRPGELDGFLPGQHPEMADVYRPGKRLDKASPVHWFQLPARIQAALFPHDILIAHGNIVFNARCIQVILEKKLSAIGDTHCIPVHFCILVHEKI